MILLFQLSVLSLLFPLALSFQVIAPSTVTIGKAAQVQWIRHNGDPSSFSLLLRRDNQDRGGMLIITITSTSDSQGTADFTSDEQTNYLIQIISDLQPLQGNQQPKQILATSSKISAVQDSNPSQTSTQTTSTTSTSSSQTTSKATPPSTNTSTDRGGNSNNGGADKSESTSSSEGGNTAGTVAGTVANTDAGRSVTAGQAQGTQDTGSGLPSLTTISTPATGTPTDSNAPSSSVSTTTGEPPQTGGPSQKTNVGVIVGTLIGGLLFLFLIFSLLFLYNRRKRRQQTLEYAFRRDLMTRNVEGAERSISFHSVSPSEFNTPGPTNRALRTSQMSSGGLTTYQKYWENQPQDSNQPREAQPMANNTNSSNNNNRNQNEESSNHVHTSNPSTNTFTSSSSLSVFYTAVPKPPQPALAPGFTFPTRAADTPTTPQTTTTTSTSTKTDRQIAIQNKMNQLRSQMIALQSRNARGSGFTEDSKSASEQGGSEREEIEKIREELERLGEIMNSGWALRRTESGGEVPAGLRA
ncbi:hypothetical protein L218DRAFT_998777 [Marasmius fiardii PR-910]|nr:hypothetical protein L218DRAFT_998777 [Marasmius fiardii PR-910]